MVNLLTTKDQMKLRARYYTGILSSFIFVLVGVCVLGTALLIPSYFLAEAEAKASVRALEMSQESVALYQSSGVVQQVSLLKERLMLLREYNGIQTTPRVLAELTTRVPEGVQVNSIALVFTGSGVGTISVSGKAKTRTALINFGKQIEVVRVFKGASVPISNLVNETNIDFSIPFSFDIKTQ